MNIWDIIIAAAIAAVVFIGWRGRKKGSCCDAGGCSGDCGHCGHACHMPKES